MIEGHRVFDFQSHVFPKECIRLIDQEKGPLEVRRDRGGELYIAERGASRGFNFLPNFLYENFDKRMRLLERRGIDVQVLSFPAPGADRFGPRLAAKISRMINDQIAELMAKSSDSLTGLASIPFSNVPEALDEMRRAVKTGGLRGVEAYSNINGQYLDSPKFFPIYRLAQSLRLPVFVHPTIPNIGPLVGREYNFSLVYGWPFDTAACMTRLAFSEVPKRFPRLRFIFAHGGGFVPFLAMRLLTLNAAYGESLGGLKPEQLGIESLKRMYADLALHYGAAVRCTVSFFSAQNCVFASDYPYGRREGLELVELSLRAVAEQDLGDADRGKILGANAARLLRMQAS